MRQDQMESSPLDFLVTSILVCDFFLHTNLMMNIKQKHSALITDLRTTVLKLWVWHSGCHYLVLGFFLEETEVIFKSRPHQALKQQQCLYPHWWTIMVCTNQVMTCSKPNCFNQSMDCAAHWNKVSVSIIIFLLYFCCAKNMNIALRSLKGKLNA